MKEKTTRKEQRAREREKRARERWFDKASHAEIILAYVLVSAIGIGLIVLSVFIASRSRPSSEAPIGMRERPATVTNAKPQELEQGLRYQVAEKQDISYLGRSRMVYRVVIETDEPPKDESVRGIVNRIWRQHGQAYDEFTVFCYLQDMETSGVAYAIAEFRTSGLQEFSVNQMIRQSRQEGGPSVERLSKDTRQRIFREGALAEDRADQEAYRMFPSEVLKETEKCRELAKKYKAAVRQKYEITVEEERAIVVEGVKKGW